MKLSTCLHQFFDQYLPCMQGCSQHTINAYRDTFSRFLPFAARYHHIKIESLYLKHLSVDLIVSCLDHLESQYRNTARTRNLRLATLKSFAKMIRLLYPQEREIAQRILNIPQKRIQRRLVGFLYSEEILKVYDAVDIKTSLGVRDYCLLHLLYDSGARASEITALNIDYFDYEKRSLAILGKGNRYRLIELWPVTADLIKHYIAEYRHSPKPLYRQRLFINQRGEELTRHGINRL